MAQSSIEIAKSGLRIASTGKKIHLKDFLPNHLEVSEVGDFMEFFEYFLNTLYYHDISATGTNDEFEIDINGTHTFYELSATSGGDRALDTSGLAIRTEITSADTISILEKIKRITELHDPDLIDIEFIQRLANLMGYDVIVDKQGISDLNLGINAQSEDDINKYIRFIVSNLPNWYKIKTTRSAVKVLLYSFGLVGDIIYRWTSDNVLPPNPSSGGYGDDLTLWTEIDAGLDRSTALQSIPENYFPTPHFIIRIDANNTPPEWLEDLDKIIDAIETIRPINNVFHSIETIFKETLISPYVRMDEYHEIKEIFPFNEVIPPYEEEV